MKRCPRKGCKSDMSEMRADAVWCSRKCYIAVRRDPKAYRDPTRHESRSGRQISYRKTVDWFAMYLIDAEGYSEDWAHYCAEQIIGELLSDRQREAA